MGERIAPNFFNETPLIGQITVPPPKKIFKLALCTIIAIVRLCQNVSLGLNDLCRCALNHHLRRCQLRGPRVIIYSKHRCCLLQPKCCRPTYAFASSLRLPSFNFCGFWFNRTLHYFPLSSFVHSSSVTGVTY